MDITKFKDYKVSGIYLFTNLINQNKYVGQSKNIYSRIQSHLRSTINPNKKDYNTPLHCAIRKYGLDAFEITVLEKCEYKLLNKREQYWISKYDSRKNGYNQTNGGNQSIRLIKLEQKQVEEIYQLLAQNKLSGAEIAKKYGITTSAVQKINMGIMWHNDKIKYPIRHVLKENNIRYYSGKAVQQIDISTGKILNTYSSTRYAASTFGKVDNHSPILRCCRGERKTALGFKWRYVDISAEDWRKLVISEK